MIVSDGQLILDKMWLDIQLPKAVIWHYGSVKISRLNKQPRNFSIATESGDTA